MGKKNPAPAPEPVAPPAAPFEMPPMIYPGGFGTMAEWQASLMQGQEQTGPSYEDQLAEQQRQQQIGRRDDLFSNRMDAAGSATDYISQLIATEQSNAALMGVDYETNDEIKTGRINNYFASIWGEGSENELTALMGDVGNPKGFTEFLVTRGDSTLADGGGSEGGRESVSSSRTRPIVPEEDEDTFGLVGTALGG